MKLIKLMIVAATLAISSAAQAECKITLSLCKPFNINKFTTFADTFEGANLDPNRCLKRAREYLTHCNSKQEVGAEFYVNGVFTISAYVTQTTSNLWTKSAGGLWIHIPGGY